MLPQYFSLAILIASSVILNRCTAFEKLTRNRRSDDVEEDDVMEPLNDYKMLLKKWFRENFVIVSNEEEIVEIGDLKNMFDKSKICKSKCENIVFSHLAHDVFPKLKSKPITIK